MGDFRGGGGPIAVLAPPSLNLRTLWPWPWGRLMVLLAACGGPLPVWAVDGQPADTVFARKIQPFLERHCYLCHDARQEKSGFRIDKLKPDFKDEQQVRRWREIRDRLTKAEMPPEEEPQPDPNAALMVVEWIADQLPVPKTTKTDLSAAMDEVGESVWSPSPNGGRSLCAGSAASIQRRTGR